MSSSDSPQQQDDTLRSALRAGIAAPPNQAEQTTLDALQSRVLAQWSARQSTELAIGNATAGLSTGILSGVFRQERRQWHLQLSFAALAFMVLIAFQVTQSGHEANMDDLLEPDVLALMAMGEL